MCQNDQVSPYPVVACKADFETTLDADGYYTYVIAATQDVPATPDPSVTVLPWGDTAVPEKLVFLRNMTPSAGFYPQSIQRSQADGSNPSASMDDYYPYGTYCDAQVLAEPGGATACVRESGGR